MEGFLLVAAVLSFASIWACKAGYKFGVPILLMFLFMGMLFGDGGLQLIMFEDFETASTIGTIALCVILFSGGMDTKISDIKPQELPSKILPGIIISLVMIFIARPASVFICLAPFKRSFKEKIFISWVGLKGAAPIIFAIMLLMADTPYARLQFNIVFVCTLISLLVQGTSLAWMAKKLNLIEESDDLSQPKNFDMEFSDDITSVTTEIQISQQDIEEHGKFIMNLPIPENTLVVMIKREGKYFIPKGKTELLDGDHLLLITDNKERLMQSLNAAGICYNNIKTDKIVNDSIIDDIKAPVNTLKNIGEMTVEKIIGK